MTQQAQPPIEALTLTIDAMVKFAGYNTFQPKAGWEWLEALHKYAPALYVQHIEEARRQGWNI